jgi:tRNA A37 threonylcarbamoyladenosine biosynthesis protein TsaE
MLTTGVLVVEWAERVLEALPKEMLRIQFRLIDEQQRDLMITALGERYEKMLTDLRYLIYGG